MEFSYFYFVMCFSRWSRGRISIYFGFSAEGIKNPEVWVYAFGQAFFSLSVAGSGTVIYGSYLSDKEDVVGAAKHVGFLISYQQCWQLV